MDRVRTALVGCGKVGQIHAQALATLAESEFVAVCDVDLPTGRSPSPRGTACGRTPTSTRCSTESDVQALLIGTPHPLHAEPAILAAEAGVHVLVEKPMAASLDDCDAMLAAARRHADQAGRDQPAAMVRAGPADEGGDRRRQDRPARARRVHHV